METELESWGLEAPQKAVPSFTFSSGLTVGIQRVNPQFIAKVRAAARQQYHAKSGELKPPTFAVELAGGALEVKPHTEDTVKLEPWATDADVQTAWHKWKTWQYGQTFEDVRATVRATVLRGVVDDAPPQKWLDERAYFGLEIPEKPLDLKWEWLFDASTGWDEMLRLAREIQSLPSELEALAAMAAEGFRR